MQRLHHCPSPWPDGAPSRPRNGIFVVPEEPGFLLIPAHPLAATLVAGKVWRWTLDIAVIGHAKWREANRSCAATTPRKF
jgi:hypothetical protein